MDLNEKQMSAVIAVSKTSEQIKILRRYYRKNGINIKIYGENPPWWIMEAAGYRAPKTNVSIQS